ncbi:MAG: DUF456 domain-containing protein [Kiritimatiellae bacterium]|nr:DUF456 domain-containing protein [Kiritimatiellia bacterium]
MMDWALTALGGVLLVVAFVGCIVPCVPGPLLGWCALLALAFSRFAIPTAWLVAAGAVMAVVTVLDYVVPAYGAKKFNCSRWGIFGCTVGTIVGMFFLPFGILIGPFAGAALGELIAGRTMGSALKGGFGAFLGFLSGVFLKLCAVCAFTGLFVWAVWLR